MALGTLGRSRGAALAVVALAVLVVSGCIPLSYQPGTARPFYCDPSDTLVNDGHGGGMFATVYTQPKGALSATDCQALAADLTASSSYVSSLKTVAQAEAAGWVQAAVWSAGQGIHYVDPSRITGPFDPTKPNWLMFDGTTPDSKLTGMMFLVQSGMMPPAGFPGDNDHWHQHHELCVAGGSPFIVGEHLTDAECAALGGVNQMFMDTWMVHVWLPSYDGWLATDIFNKTHPSLP